MVAKPLRLLLLLLSPLATLPSTTSTSCPVTTHGARCDGAADDTAAIQSALDSCGCTYAPCRGRPAPGCVVRCAGTVALPWGRTCLSFPLRFHNGTQLRIPPGATLKAFPDVARWPNATMFNFVELKHRRDVAVFGGGTVDGSGEQWWNSAGLGDARPRLFHMESIRNVSFADVTLTNSAAGTLLFGTPCWDVVVDGVTVRNPAIGNTDGIDVGCDGFVVQNSRVTNGDDSICMKAGAKNGVIRNCTVHNGRQLMPATANYPGRAGGLVLGTSDSDSMENITFSNCTVVGALAGIRIKFRPSQSGFVKQVTWEQIRIVRPIVYAVDLLMNSNHLQRGWPPLPTHASHAARIGAPRTVTLSDITLRDIVAELGPVPAGECRKGDNCPRAVGRFLCSALHPCRGLLLENVRVTGFNATAKYPIPCTFTNASGSGAEVRPAECTPPPDPAPLITYHPLAPAVDSSPPPAAFHVPPLPPTPPPPTPPPIPAPPNPACDTRGCNVKWSWDKSFDGGTCKQ
eukprot:SAG25_NODE_2360_length_1681_cov_2.218078_1_plen_514_part_10